MGNGSEPKLAPVFVYASVAQKHLVVAGAAAARQSRTIRDIRSGRERSRRVVVEADRAGNGYSFVAGLANGYLAGVALPDGNLLVLPSDGPSGLGAVRSIGERQCVAGAITLVERLGQRRRCDAHRRQHGNEGKL